MVSALIDRVTVKRCKVVRFSGFIHLQFDAVPHDAGNAAGGVVVVAQFQGDGILAGLQHTSGQVERVLLVAATQYGTAIYGAIALVGPRVIGHLRIVYVDIHARHVCRAGSRCRQAERMVGVVDVELDVPCANLCLGIVPVGGLVAAASGEGQVSGRLLVKAVAAVGIAQFVAIAQAVALTDAEHFCSETLRSPHDIAQVGVRSTDDHPFTGQLAGVAAAQGVGRQGVGAGAHVAYGERAVALRLCPIDVTVTLIVRLGRLRQHYAYGRGRIVVIHRQASVDGGSLRGV